jgi:uncharacterized protein with von Willebrand factor type A (vWA) domain
VKVETVQLPLPDMAAAFERRLRAAGLPVGPERAARFAEALAVVRPIARRRLYWTARAVFVSDRTHVPAFDSVFSDVFGSRVQSDRLDEPDTLLTEARAPDAAPPSEEPRVTAESNDLGSAATMPRPGRDPIGQDADDQPVPMLASDEEVLRAKRFDALDPDELAQLHRLMSRLSLATPNRLTRRSERRRHGPRIDVRRTLRGSMRSAGDPIRLARRERRVVRRRIVLLCDISGSMEPYARAYLQFLVCAAGAGPRAEAFVFATRLTRLTRALASRNPDRAIERAAAAAPDWSSGTRIGDALKEFNDRHGRRGMARGAVIVILSDGWERGDPSLVAREMERLRRLAYRIVWVNPRVGARGFSPRVGGMEAALPFCDALVSGHTLEALDEVAKAIAAPRGADDGPVPADPVAVQEGESWASATPVPGSSVAMPSGYGPSRGRTTPGWGLGE